MLVSCSSETHGEVLKCTFLHFIRFLWLMSLRNKSGEENLNYILAIKNSLVTGMSRLVECINSIRCRCYIF